MSDDNRMRLLEEKVLRLEHQFKGLNRANAGVIVNPALNTLGQDTEINGNLDITGVYKKNGIVLDWASGLLRPLLHYRLRAFYPVQPLGYVGGASLIPDYHPSGNHLAVSGSGRTRYTDYGLWASVFNGSSSYHYAALTSQISPTNAFGFGCWMMLTGASSAHGIFRIGTTTVGATANVFISGSNFNFQYGYYDTGGTFREGCAIVLPQADYLNKWIFFACNHNYTASGDNSFEMQINDVYDIEQNKAYASGMRTPAGNFELGRGATAPNYFQGNMISVFLDGGYKTDWDYYFPATRHYFGV